MTYKPEKTALEAASRAYCTAEGWNPDEVFEGNVFWETETHGVSAAITSYMESMFQQNMAEVCEHFAWSDDQPHKFAADEDNGFPTVIIMKIGEA